MKSPQHQPEQFNTLRTTSFNMVSRDQRKAALLEKLQRLRAVTGSHAVNKTSSIVDASEYIKELKERVELFEQESDTNLPMEVNVETLDRGFRINVYSERSCPGLLVSILEAFEELGLNVQDARVSCSDNFSLEAVGEEGRTQVEEDERVDAHVVKQAVLQAIKNWSEEKKGLVAS